MQISNVSRVPKVSALKAVIDALNVPREPSKTLSRTLVTSAPLEKKY